MSAKTRSSLGIDAVASAAALGSAHALNPLNKPATLGALAGFVPRLFRTKTSEPERENQAPANARPMCGQSTTKPQRQATSAAALEKGGTDHGQG